MEPPRKTNMSKYCVNCGRANRDNDDICYYCSKLITIKQKDKPKENIHGDDGTVDNIFDILGIKKKDR